MTEIPNLERRRIQGEIIKPIYDELVAEIGESAAQALLARAVRRSVKSEAERAAAAQSAPPEDMTNFNRNFEKTYANQGPKAGLDVDIVRSEETALEFNVTRCRFVEMYRELGLGDIAHILSCDRDGQFATAFDPNIRLDRPQTIADGAPTCVFRYSYDKKADPEEDK